MFDFYASDLGTQLVFKSKHYWQNEKANCCIIVPDATTTKEAVVNNKSVLLAFIQVAPGKSVHCTNIHDPERATFVADTEDLIFVCKSFKRSEGRVIRPENCGKIANAIFDLIDNQSWSFPRNTGNGFPYISPNQASLLEQDFTQQIRDEVPNDCVVLSIAEAGTMLAERIGIRTDGELQASHYDTKTNTQIDDRIKVTSESILNVRDKNVLIIDDLISSGRTAQAVIDYLMTKSAKHIYFYALYRTVASQEVNLSNSDWVTIRSHTPISNAYWTYGRGFDLSDERSRNFPAIYGATKHWSWETDRDVDDLIEFFEEGYPLDSYEND